MKYEQKRSSKREKSTRTKAAESEQAVHGKIGLGCREKEPNSKNLGGSSPGFEPFVVAFSIVFLLFSFSFFGFALFYGVSFSDLFCMQKP
jgi:hypothetical protein